MVVVPWMRCRSGRRCHGRQLGVRASRLEFASTFSLTGRVTALCAVLSSASSSGNHVSSLTAKMHVHANKSNSPLWLARADLIVAGVGDWGFGAGQMWK
jgi:hypothetical protein